MRIRCDLAYCGKDFHGWAAQPGLRTVEGVVMQACETLLRRQVRLTVAGRTDAGVHAAGQVAHFDVTAEEWQRLPGRSTRSPAEALTARIQGIMQRHPDVVIRAMTHVPDTFDARFAACGRHYCYRIADSALTQRPWRLDVQPWRERLDIEAMNFAAQALLGEHDFLPFARPRAGATTIRTLTHIHAARVDGLVEIRVSADAFCHSQVRFMVGALARVGQGQRPITWIGDLLAAGVRDSAVPLAPAAGLTLERVDYPDPEAYASQTARTRRRRA